MPRGPAPLAVARQEFPGTVQAWCEQGFSICEGYLLELQALHLDGNAEGLLAMIEAQPDPEMAAEAMARANVLVSGAAFAQLSGRPQLLETGAPGPCWPMLANLWRAMEMSKGDLPMPRLAPAFERRLREALRLS
ncbi:hypothetical protein [Paracoccus sp. (in: a-proteobacteria)]|uniref:hypothetical protein n=1 Tax=Paracoccus sp. TaxID=267 RepID=UPI00321F8E70